MFYFHSVQSVKSFNSKFGLLQTEQEITETLGLYKAICHTLGECPWENGEEYFMIIESIWDALQMNENTNKLSNTVFLLTNYLDSISVDGLGKVHLPNFGVIGKFDDLYQMRAVMDEIGYKLNSVVFDSYRFGDNVTYKFVQKS